MASNKGGIPKHLIIFGSVLIVLALVFIFLILSQTGQNDENINSSESENLANNSSPVQFNTQDNREVYDPNVDGIEIVESLDGAVATTVGSNLISKEGKVVNDKGQVVQNNALPMTDFAPKLSQPVNEDELIEGVIKLRADENGFSPNSFTVKAGEPVTVSLTAVGLGSRLVFADSALIGLELPVPAGYTMSKTFNAPTKGEYKFYQDMPGRANQTGVMVVVD